jgi:hypothetical protein
VKTGIRTVVIVAALLVMLLAMLVALVNGHDQQRRIRFLAACEAVKRGETPAEVAESLEAEDGRYQGASQNVRIWHVEGVISRRRGFCGVLFDETGAVRPSAWSEQPK